MVVRLHGTVMPTGDYSCPFCGRGFWTRRDLDNHIRNDHHFSPEMFNQNQIRLFCLAGRFPATFPALLGFYKMTTHHTNKEINQINSLEQLVSKSYKRVIKNMEYPLGEIDLIGVIDDNSWDIYEVKTSMRGYDKAILQLNRATKYYHNKILNRFIYIANEGLIEKV